MISTLDEFTIAYIECALWSTNDESDESDESGGNPLDENYSIDDIDPDTLKEMSEDCRKFQEENAADLAQYDSLQWMGGYDFWLTRNGHGAGFWDRNCLSVDARECLTEASRKYGEYNLYVGYGTIYGY